MTPGRSQAYKTGVLAAGGLLGQGQREESEKRGLAGAVCPPHEHPLLLSCGLQQRQAAHRGCVSRILSRVRIDGHLERCVQGPVERQCVQPLTALLRHLPLLVQPIEVEGTEPLLQPVAGGPKDRGEVFR